MLANKQDREDCVEVVRIKEGFVRRVFEEEQGGMVRDNRVRQSLMRDPATQTQL